MYSIFNIQSRKSKRLEEGEPSPKKLDLEKNLLIKDLSKQQLQTTISLPEQLTQKKDFISHDVMTDISGHIKGATTLTEFKEKVDNQNEINKLKSQGLNEQDIQIFHDYKTLGDEFWTKYKTVNKDFLCEQIRAIERTTSSTSNTLTLASEHSLIHPMNKIKQLEEQINKNLETSNINIKKIRKKARSLGNKIESTNHPQGVLGETKSLKKAQRPTLWDVKEVPPVLQKRTEVKSHMYTCKPQSLYTIKDGKIIKLSHQQEASLVSHKEGLKLSIEEIKAIPKFSNYDQGNASKALYLKNLSKDVTEVHLRALLQSFKDNFTVKLMSGKMRGQAFIEFKDEKLAFDALQILNGTVIGGKPMIVQFGNKKS